MHAMRGKTSAALMAGWLLAAAGASHGVTVGGLRCEQLVDPMGIDTVEPRLSWVLESDQRGVVQSAYQVLVAGDRETLDADQGDLWDTGKVASDRSIQIPYAGAALASGQGCFWKVRVWDGDGAVSAWSPMARWSVGLLRPEDWKGLWIGLDAEDPVEEVEEHVAAPLEAAQWVWHPQDGPSPAQSAPTGKAWFRRTFALPADRPLASARVWLTADNGFVLFVNGQELGRATNFSILYGYDVTEALRAGDNVIAIEGDNLGDSDNPAGLLVALRVAFQDGDPLILHSDGDWKAAREVSAGWEQPDLDDTAWPKVQVLGAFGMGPWGRMEEEAGDFRRLRARYLRREFAVKPALVRATAHISGLGLSELYLNGVRVGDQVLSPGLTEYPKRVFYLTHDVTDHLRAGENAVGVLLGNGRYYAPRLIVPTRTITYGFPKLLFQMRLDYADGSHELVVSDLTWKLTTEGPLGANNEYDGEEYDARQEMPGWAEPGFDAGAWQDAQATTAPGGALRAEMTPPIRVTETLRPIAMTEPEPGVFIFDMGQNMVGWCGMKVRGPRGTVVRQRHAEVLKDDGTLYLDNIRSALVTNTYTLKGEGWEYYEPRFTYHGFRYVEVTGYPGRPDLSSIAGMVVHDDVAPAGDFECSHPLLNQIYSNIRWGVRGNYRSFPTDCPQRDERQAWLGDRSAECKGESYMFDIGPLYAKWNLDMLDSQTEKGAISDVCPPYWPFYSNNVTWPSTFVIVPGMLYDQYGDTRTMAAVYDGMVRWVDFMSGFLTDHTMPRDQYGDWCVPPESPELIHSRDPARRTNGEVLGTTYFYHVVRSLARYADILGKPDDVERFDDLADKILAAFNRKFLDGDRNQYDNGTQTAHVLPLSFDMVPEGRREPVFDHLVRNIEEQSNRHIGTGLIGAQWLMRTLSDNGRADLAFDIATQTTYPSWGYMIEQGATTIWELWNGDTADPAMNSRNHVMLVGDLGIWMTEVLAGIRRDPSAPAFKRIILEPHLVGTLDHVRAHYDSIHGRIESHWQVDGAGRLEWQVRVPANTTATVSVPTTRRESVREGDTQADQAPGVTFLREEAGRVVYQVGSGAYRFTARVD